MFSIKSNYYLFIRAVSDLFLSDIRGKKIDDQCVYKDKQEVEIPGSTAIFQMGYVEFSIIE